MSDPATRELLRNRILLLVAEAPSRGMAVAAMQVGVEVAGFTIAALRLLQELDYLQSKGYVAQVRSDVSAGMQRYTLTASGREYLEGQGLV